MIARNKPADEWKLVTPERINKGQSIEQNFYRIVMTGLLNRLPVLSLVD